MRIKGTKERPRISIFRSNSYTYAQAIDDESKKTVAAFSSLQLIKQKPQEKAGKSVIAKQVGIELAKKLKEKKVTQALLDRGVYAYLGRVKELAEGLREGGIII